MRIIKIIGVTFLVLFVSAVVIMIGISTSIVDDSIAPSEVTLCEKVVEIIKRNQNRIDSALIRDAVGDGKCIRKSIRSDADWDVVFLNISMSDRKYLHEFTDSKICKYVEISESNDCVLFLFYTSFHKSFIIGSYQQLYLIYHLNPTCNCKENPIGDPNYPIATDSVKKNWYKVRVRISKRHFHA